MTDELIHESFLRLLHEAHLESEWEISQREMPRDTLPFLAPESVTESCRLAGFEAEAIPYLCSAAHWIASNAELTCLAWHCHYLLCHSPSYSRGDARQWTPLANVLKEWAGAFYLLIALSGVPQIRAFHQSRGIPERVARDTYSDTSLWAEAYRAKHRTWGIEPHILPWLFNHLSGELYRLGRLQFIQRPFRQKLIAFRHRATRAVQVIADAGVRYRGDGQLDGTGGVVDSETGWTSRLLIDGERVVGTPIHPTGIALREEVCLLLNAWERVLAPGDPILEIHIPAGSRMDFDACGDSLRQAADFFPRYFPERPFQGFCCASWLLNTQFQKWLSSDSNMVRFQREFYLFPIFSSGRSGFDRIFGDDIRDLSTAPRDTSLRRAVLDHLQAGGYLRGGGALLFVEDLAWGRQVYHNKVSS